MVTVALPSMTLLFGAVSVNVAEVLPATMVTVAGTVIREVVSDKSDTVRFVVSVPEIETVPVPVAPSMTVAGSTSARFRFSLSSTAMLPEVPSVQFTTCAVIVAFCVPSILLSSTTVIGKFAEVCPAGMFTVAGTVTAVTSLELSDTATAFPAGLLIVTVPWIVPTPSVVVAGAVTESVAVSLSYTVSAATPSA